MTPWVARTSLDMDGLYPLSDGRVLVPSGGHGEFILSRKEAESLYKSLGEVLPTCRYSDGDRVRCMRIQKPGDMYQWCAEHSQEEAVSGTADHHAECACQGCVDPVEPLCTAATPCCARRDHYNGYNSGPLLFTCVNHCACHD